MNGFNQFTTRFNPFGNQPQQNRLPPQQVQPQFQPFPTVQQPQQGFQQPLTQPNPNEALGQNFQTVRFPNGQVVTQNQQFGVISNQGNSFVNQGFTPQVQTPPPPPQQPGTSSSLFRQASQRFPPVQDSSSVFSLTSPQRVQSNSAFSQSFDQSDQQSVFRPNEEQFRSTPSSPQPNGLGQDVNGARVRLRPSSATVGPFGDQDLSRRPVSRARGRPTTPSPFVTDPNALTTGPRFGNQFSSQGQEEFVRGSPDDSPTPPPTISRVRGRPIVPEDFPGPSQAVRGALPDDESTEDRGGGRLKLVGVRRQRVRPGLRVVPTGIRARQPIDQSPQQVEQNQGETPRSSFTTTGSQRFKG